MVVLSSVVFAIVMVMFAYAIWRYRAKPGDESDGEPIHGNTRLEIAWTVIPTVIVLFAAGYSWVVLDDIEAKADDRMPVKVTAQQFEWTLRVPRGRASPPNELHVPVDRQLERRADARSTCCTPSGCPSGGSSATSCPAAPAATSIDDDVRRHADEEGTFSLICTELCGLGHATMRADGRGRDPSRSSSAWVASSRTARGAGAAGVGRRRQDAGVSDGSAAISEELAMTAALTQPGLVARACSASLIGGGVRVRRSSSPCARSPGSRSSRPSRPATRT